MAFDRTDNVHHVAVTLNEHELIDLHAAKFAHASDVVAAEIDKHYVLGAFFFVLKHFFCEREVLRLGGSAAARAGDGPVLHFAFVHAHQQLGRGACQLEEGGLRPF